MKMPIKYVRKVGVSFCLCLQSTSRWGLCSQSLKGEAVCSPLRADGRLPAVRPEWHRCFQHLVKCTCRVFFFFLHWHVTCFRSCVGLRMGSGAGVCTETGPAMEDAPAALSPSGTRWQPGVSVLLWGYGTRHSSATGQKRRGAMGMCFILHMFLSFNWARMPYLICHQPARDEFKCLW